MINRRGLLLASGAATIGPSLARAQNSPATGFDPVTEWGFGPPVSEPDSSGTRPTGTKPPKHGEIAKGFKLLYAAPRDQSPLAVARYFEVLPDKNEDGHFYRHEWPKDGRANPLIVGLFSSTFTIPSKGDQTAWCAAFVNFCLLASGKPTTGSAQSGSFRSNPAFPKTDTPKPGDIVVFRLPGPDGDLGFGHVGLFLSETSTHVEVLGGNQVGTTKTSGAVTVTKFPFKSADLELHSYRSVT
ncbi:CHAP domain-containing protein [Bosea sp. BE125]|uniref:CHAP domain-containing protein n=1 Tax=Bosea sp. BE125 TaxID=2817909 RepID=UPI00286D3850|nr:CHAP domain-containing protein [Bosea sp. BE125]